ncbi:hypothetical protein OSTOST_18652 [Ostertagia ostertagi]
MFPRGSGASRETWGNVAVRVEECARPFVLQERNLLPSRNLQDIHDVGHSISTQRDSSRTTVKRLIRVKRKYSSRQSTVAIKSHVEHEWGGEILRCVLELRKGMLQKSRASLPAEIPPHLQQLAEKEDTAANLKTQVLRIENLRSGLKRF